MDRNDIAAELHAIRGALDDWPDPTITGGQLATLIRRAAPNLDLRAAVGIPKGPGALTEFMSRYLPGLVERIGKQGADILHRIAGREVAKLPASASPQVWRTFVSPNSSQHLVLSRSARCMTVRDDPASSDDELEVPKATADEHDAIRADFVAGLPEPAATVLTDSAPMDADFTSWILAMKQHLPEKTRMWGQHRRHSLSKLFETRIAELEIEEPLRQSVLEQVKTAERLAYSKPNGSKGSARQQTELESEAAVDIGEITQARRLAHAAIDGLSYDELRALRLPLGAMLDAIRAKS